ncbi:MAG: hypothetical protein IJU54_01470 [Alphaproteobacteria bacterium]|nr:hypothetical protein [Alphaproteobacteria bacterium]
MVVLFLKKIETGKQYVNRNVKTKYDRLKNLVLINKYKSYIMYILVIFNKYNIKKQIGLSKSY